MNYIKIIIVIIKYNGLKIMYIINFQRIYLYDSDFYNKYIKIKYPGISLPIMKLLISLKLLNDPQSIIIESYKIANDIEKIVKSPLELYYIIILELNYQKKYQMMI